MDFPAWLGNNTAPSDNVIVQMDLGEGREFEMLQSLLLSDRLTLIDHLFVQWHYQAKVITLPCVSKFPQQVTLYAWSVRLCVLRHLRLPYCCQQGTLPSLSCCT